MQVKYTERFRRNYENAPSEIRRAFDRRALFLAQNLRYPSLRAKKYDEANDVWQARVNDDWHFYPPPFSERKLGEVSDYKNRQELLRVDFLNGIAEIP